VMTDLTNRSVTTIVKMALLVVLAGVPLHTAFSHDAIDVDADVFPWSSVGKIYNSARCRGDAPDFVEVGEAGIAVGDAMRRECRVQLVG
jgi:hypothetical protein